MARTKVEVNKSELQAQINTAEANGALAGLSELFDKIAATEWATSKNYTASILRARTVEFNIPTKTLKGKPGRKASTAPAQAPTT